MRTVDRYTLARGPADGGATLVRAGAPAAGVAVDGSVLEAQFALPDGGALVWLTDEGPFDEGLHVYLLGPDDAVRDAVEAGAAWTAGAFGLRGAGQQPTGEAWAEFQFFRNGCVYRLDVAPTPRLRSPLPRGWRYKTPRRAHQLVVSQLPAGG